MLCTHLVLTRDQFVKLEQDTIQSGAFSADGLMHLAGTLVASFVEQLCQKPRYKILVISGPGNNGGDGMVAAYCLRNNKALSVDLWFCGDKDNLSSSAYNALNALEGKFCCYDSDLLKDLARYDLIIDALFGTGLNRALDTKFIKIIDAVNSQDNVKVISVDIPSGFDGSNLIERGSVIQSDFTITFTCPKIFHLLCPGLLYAGKLVVGDLPIKITKNDSTVFFNSRSLWEHLIPRISTTCHKYSRGYALVYGGDLKGSGAAILASRAIQRIGAGVVKILAPEDKDVLVYKLALYSALVGLHNDEHDKRVDAVLVGPGNGLGSSTLENIKSALKFGNCVIDADAISVFNNSNIDLFNMIKQSNANVVLTPHEGEFHKLFGPFNLIGNKVERVKQASKLAGAVVLLKGPDTVIADPQGRVVISCNLGAKLATAGSGDVLAGIITGLMAMQKLQRDDTLLLVAMAAYIHGRCAYMSGVENPIAEDLIDSLKKFTLDGLLASNECGYNIIHYS